MKHLLLSEFMDITFIYDQQMGNIFYHYFHVNTSYSLLNYYEIQHSAYSPTLNTGFRMAEKPVNHPSPPQEITGQTVSTINSNKEDEE